MADIVLATPKRVVVGTIQVAVEEDAVAARLGVIKLTAARITVNVEYLSAEGVRIAEMPVVFIDAEYDEIAAALIDAGDAGKGVVQMFERQVRKAVKQKLTLVEATT